MKKTKEQGVTTEPSRRRTQEQAACSRCGKKTEVNAWKLDIDLPALYFCANCQEIGPWEIASRELVTTGGTCHEWREAFADRKPSVERQKEGIGATPTSTFDPGGSL